MITLRTLLALAVDNDLDIIHQLDVKSVFLKSKLNEDVYMLQPEGLDSTVPV